MKWMERIAWGLALLGLVFRVMHWPGAGILLVVGLSAVATAYFPLGWLLFGQPTRKDQLIPLSVITGLVLSLMVIGILFKLQFWPGADFDLLVGLLGGVAVLVAVITLHSRNTHIEDYFKGLRHRLVLIGLPTLLLYLVPTSDLIRLNYRHDPERAALLIKLQEAPGDTAARYALDQLDAQRRGH